MKKPYAVVFAGVPGSSKSIVAFYLSGKFGLPIFNNDQLRYEVREDLLVDSINIPHALEEFEKRLKQRVDEILAKGKPIIIDGSVDRRWIERKKQLQDFNYEWFLIDMELSKEFLTNLFNKTGRAEFVTTQLDDYLKQHEEFIDKYSSDVSIYIKDEDFKNRNEIAAEALSEFIHRRG